MKVKEIAKKVRESSPCRNARAMRMHGELRGGQGTVEYAVIVAIIVIGVAAVLFGFREKLIELWQAVTAQLDEDLNTVVGPGE